MRCRSILLLFTISIISCGAAGTEVIDEFMSRFIAKNKVPGAAVAVTRQGKLVYACGFGWADKNEKTPVQATSLFRIASISKPITSVAVMQLVQSDRIQLDDPMSKHLKGMDIYRRHPNYDERLNRITVRDLLRHSGGWDREKSFDPMGLSGHLRVSKALGIRPPVGTRDVMNSMFRLPLQFDPGSEFQYSNFGYLLLGRLIEDLTGLSYEAYVQKHVLKPIGVSTMRIGHMEKEKRAPTEVTYYDRRQHSAIAPYGRHRGKKVPNTYARPMQVMDAHGGWIASAIDLARFACAFDNPADSKLLNARSIKTMFARQPGLLGQDTKGKPKAAYYALGWMVRPKAKGAANTWHSGSIQGTSTLLVRRHDGFNWAILFNANSNPNGKRLISIIDAPMHRVINSVHSWPKHDLFEK